MKIYVKRSIGWDYYAVANYTPEVMVPWLGTLLMAMKGFGNGPFGFTPPFVAPAIDDFLSKAAAPNIGQGFEWTTPNPLTMPSCFFMDAQGNVLPFNVSTVHTVLDTYFPLIPQSGRAPLIDFDAISPNPTGKVRRTPFGELPSINVAGTYLAQFNGFTTNYNGVIPGLNYAILPDGSPQLIESQAKLNTNGKYAGVEAMVSGITTPGQGGFIDLVPQLSVGLDAIDPTKLAYQANMAGFGSSPTYKQTIVIDVDSGSQVNFDQVFFCGPKSLIINAGLSVPRFSGMLSADGKTLSGINVPDIQGNGDMVAIKLGGLQINSRRGYVGSASSAFDSNTNAAVYANVKYMSSRSQTWVSLNNFLW